MAQYRTVEGETSATANTFTNLTTFGAETGVGPVKVPAGATKLAEIWVAIGAAGDTAGDSAAYLLRLGGKGMKSGDQDLIIGAIGSGVTSTGTVFSSSQIYPVAMEVVPNETINVSAANTGSTILATTLGVTLVFP